MTIPHNLKGVIPPIVTPLTAEEAVDVAGMRTVIEYLIGAGVHGLLVLGSTGEFWALSDKVRAKAIETAVEAANGRVPVLAGVSDASTNRALAHAQAARLAGADYLIATPPYYGTMSQDWVERHYLALAEATDLPLVLYNVPPWVPTDVNPATVARLSEHPNIVGIKDSAHIGHMQDIVFRTKENGFRVLVGSGYQYVAGLLVGTVGGTPLGANVCPRNYVAMYDLMQSGQPQAALALQAKTNQLIGVLEAMPFWVSAVKGALSLMGLCNARVATPAAPATEAELETLAVELRKFDLLPT